MPSNRSEDPVNPRTVLIMVIPKGGGRGESRTVVAHWPEDEDAERLDRVARSLRSGRPLPDRSPQLCRPCAAWLAAYLRDGERSSVEVMAAGREAGFSRAQLYYSKQRAGVGVRKLGLGLGFDGKSQWAWFLMEEPAEVQAMMLTNAGGRNSSPPPIPRVRARNDAAEPGR